MGCGGFDAMRYDAIRCDAMAMEWDEIGRDGDGVGVAWDAMRCDAMRCDAM